MVAWSGIEGPLLFAHRGASLERPENTLPAFELGLQLGADVLELDVHPSRDGVFVVSHDPTGTRMCGVERALSDCDWPEIARWDAGFGFVDREGRRSFAGAGVHPSRFEDVLDALPGALLNVDVKDAREAELRKLLDVIDARGAESRVLLTSFLACVLRVVRRLGYQGPLGLSQREVVRLVFTPAFVTRWLPFAGRRVQIPTRSGPLDLTRAAFFAKCRALGLALDYWVINEPEAARRLLQRGAAGIITDDTRSLASVFGDAPETSAWRSRRRR
jgi:glycerophosphoryl diester phosphodiesterase